MKELIILSSDEDEETLVLVGRGSVKLTPTRSAQSFNVEGPIIFGSGATKFESRDSSGTINEDFIPLGGRVDKKGEIIYIPDSDDRSTLSPKVTKRDLKGKGRALTPLAVKSDSFPPPIPLPITDISNISNIKKPNSSGSDSQRRLSIPPTPSTSKFKLPEESRPLKKLKLEVKQRQRRTSACYDVGYLHVPAPEETNILMGWNLLGMVVSKPSTQIKSPKKEVKLVLKKKEKVKQWGVEALKKIPAQVLNAAIIDNFMKSQIPNSARRSLLSPLIPTEAFSNIAKFLATARHNNKKSSQPGDQFLFNLLIQEGTSKERNSPKITIIPSTAGAPFSPPLQNFIYSNRIVYPPDLIPVRPHGCGCSGKCSDAKNSTCSCLLKQIEASRTKKNFTAVDRSNSKKFAWNEEGKLAEMNFDEPIFECGIDCSCSSKCQNRVAGNGTKIDLEIYHDSDLDWGVRTVETIPAGTFIGIYAGELLNKGEGERRGQIERGSKSFLYGLDHWSFFEEYEDPTSEYDIDATKSGNFTRYFNSNCVPSVSTRILYGDEAHPKRPQLIFFSNRIIEAGDDLTISYFGCDEPELEKGESLEEYMKKADKVRNESFFPCFCKSKMCRGNLFDTSEKGESSKAYMQKADKARNERELGFQCK